ncbi:phospholipase D family protein [Siccirubricoccus sp. G192]|uniref:phospholipase D family protein n=1 Tax=Siccirubricoccus sp. G192 TaxID=2849651 RepID=UPI001C2C8413|nr:phospholipase D family protein [Siccirubricoccus sp. G192]MBV1798260.1 phospholipase D family protein [Siccirubricoccus sp. G192]
MSTTAPARPAAGSPDPLRGLADARSLAGLVSDGLDAFALRALAARGACRSLDLQYYIWRGDLTGRLLAREALLAADRGVRVRLLLDDIYVVGADRTLAILAKHPSIEVRLFNATRLRSWGRFGFMLEMLLGGFRLNRRMHNKAWIADGGLALVGGRNIGDEYFDASGEFNFRDLDLFVAGEAAAQASAIFETYWQAPLSTPVARYPTASKPARKLPALRRLLERRAAAPAARPFRERLRRAPVLGRILAGKHVLVAADTMEILADPPAKATGAPLDGVAEAVDAALATAQHEALLISPYFVPGERGMALLTGLLRRGVRVAVVTNSLAATDVAAVHGGYARYRHRLLEAGAELWELKRGGEKGRGVLGSRGASLHTKAFVVDGGLIFVGSFNLDPRSAKLNTEMGGFVRHPELGRRLGADSAGWPIRRGATGCSSMRMAA